MTTQKTGFLKDKQTNTILPITNAVLVRTTVSNVQEELNQIKEEIRYVSLFKGVYENQTALLVAYPNGEIYDDGIWAILTSTDTVWVYDNDTTAWINTGSIISSVTSVNYKGPDSTGNILLVGGDINSTINNPVTSLEEQKTITQHLQQLYDYIDNEKTDRETELLNYVKKTDYATGRYDEGKAGIVGLGAGNGIIQSSGNLAIEKATNSDISAKSQSFKPIVPSNLNYAIERGLGANTLIWTENEKLSARNTIGATDIAIVTQVDMTAVIEGNKIKAYLDDTLHDFTFQNQGLYKFNIILPAVLLTLDLPNNYVIEIYDKIYSDSAIANKVVINNIFHISGITSTTVGDMCSLQNYNINTGVEWTFNGRYTQYMDGSNTRRVIYTSDVTRESNPSMSGSDLYANVVNNSIKTGTSVFCLSDYTNGTVSYSAGVMYKITGEVIGGDLIIDATALHDPTREDISHKTNDIDYSMPSATNYVGELGLVNYAPKSSIDFATNEYIKTTSSGPIIHETDIAPVLLWENANVGVDFAGGYTELSDTLANYERLRILYQVSKTDSTTSIKEFIPSGGNWANKMWIFDVLGLGNVVCRAFYKGTATSLYWESGSNAISGATGDDVMIPYRIYGIKEGI